MYIIFLDAVSDILKATACESWRNFEMETVANRSGRYCDKQAQKNADIFCFTESRFYL